MLIKRPVSASIRGMSNHNHDDQGRSPGTLTPDEVKDELRQFKDKLLSMPSTLSGMARSAVGRGAPPGQPAPQARQQQQADLGSQATQLAAPQPAQVVPAAELMAYLESIDRRLGALEAMVAEIRAKVAGVSEGEG